METIDILKPYRCEQYDKMDKKYADKLKEYYSVVPIDIKNKFNIYTEHLMNDSMIKKKELIKAIEGFEIYNIHLNLFLCNEWCEFTDMAETCNGMSYCNII